MKEIFSKTFYGNTIAEWAITLLILFGSLILAKLVYWFSSNIVKKFTTKTKTKLDDILVDMVEEPIVLAIVIIGIWYASEYLTLSEYFVSLRSKLFYILITFDVAWLFVRLIDALIVEYLQPIVEKTEGDLDDQMLPIVRKGIKVIIWTIAIIVGLNNAGYDVGALIAGLGIGGLALAMAAKDSVANLFGGITIFTDQPFVINDVIKINGIRGTVREIGIRSTRLITREGRKVTIPNSKFSDSAIENISSQPSYMIFTDLKLPYNTTSEQMEQVKKIIKEATKIEEIEICFITFMGFNDFCLNLSVLYYIKLEYNKFMVQNVVNTSIFNKLKEANIQLAVPTQNIKKID